MAEMKSLNGNEIVDAKARKRLDDLDKNGGNASVKSGYVSIPVSDWGDSNPTSATIHIDGLETGSVCLLTPADSVTKTAAEAAQLSALPSSGVSDSVIVIRAQAGTVPTNQMNFKYMILRSEEATGAPLAAIIGIDTAGIAEGGGVDETAVRNLIMQNVPDWARAPTKPTYNKSEVGLGNVENERQYSNSNPPDYPVESVNDKTGAVKLSATDVGARSSSWTPSASEVGADPSGTASQRVSEHDTFTGSHQDIRLQISELRNQLNDFLDVDDETRNELSEVLALIDANADVIAGITTSKVSVTDIIDNLTTNVSNKPLSAAQGAALKKLIDALTIDKLDASALTAAKLATVLGYTPADAANVPTNLSQLTGDSTHRTVTDMEKETWNSKVGTNELNSEVTAQLTAAKESGDFKGDTGKSAYLYAKDGGYTGTEEEFAEKLAAEHVLNSLWGKKVSFLGDSICAGSNTENSYLGGYGRIIAERNNMVYENLAQGGATITAGTISLSTGLNRMWICRKVDEMSADADYAIVEGGINDAWYTGEGRVMEIGTMSTGYNAELDDTTYYGAFESMLKKLVTRFAGKKIGYIAVPKIMDKFDSERNVPNFYHIALECCAKWGVPVCDLNTIVPPFTYIEKLKNAYAPDGTHPNYEGYVKYYCDPIEEWMKTLTVGGNNAASVARKAVDEYTQGFNDAITALRNGKLDNKGISFRKALLNLVDGTTIEIDVLTALDGSVVIPYVNRIPVSIDTDGTIFGVDYNGDGTKDGYLSGQRLSSSGTTKEQAYSYVTGYMPAKGGDEICIFGCGWGTTLNSMNYICAYDENFSYIGGHATQTGASSTALSQYSKKVASLKSVDENRDTILILADDPTIAYIRVSSVGNATGYDANLKFENAIVTVNEEIV